MKNPTNSLALLFLFFLASSLPAQDLIVTAKGDSINASVTKIKKDYIHFVFDYKGEIRQTLLPVDEVKYHENYFEVGAVPEDSIPDTNGFSRYRLGLVGGLSHLTAPIAEQQNQLMESHIRDLKSGAHYGGDFDFFISELIGVGLRYRMFRTKNSINNVEFLDFETAETTIGRIKDDIRVQFFGPALITRMVSKSGDVHFSAGMSVGYVSLYNSAIFLEEIKIRSETYGIGFDVALDFKLDDNVAIGFGVSLIGMNFSTIQYDYAGTSETVKLGSNSRENFSRLDLSIALKWYHHKK